MEICNNCGTYFPGDTSEICMYYEQQKEYSDMMYHHFKNTGYWALVKLMVNESFKDINNNIFLIDILEDYLTNHNINYYSINEIKIKYNNEYYIIPKYEAQHLMENLKINSQNQPYFGYEYDVLTGNTFFEINY